MSPNQRDYKPTLAVEYNAPTSGGDGGNPLDDTDERLSDV